MPVRDLASSQRHNVCATTVPSCRDDVSVRGFDQNRAGTLVHRNEVVLVAVGLEGRDRQGVVSRIV